jgi:ABC-2 type transport system ATP-binding protein
MSHKSRKILDGSIREIKSRFRPLEIRASLSQLSQELPATWRIEASEEEKVDLLLPLNGQSPNQLLLELMNFGEVISFQERFPSMEEIFIQQVNASGHA